MFELKEPPSVPRKIPPEKQARAGRFIIGAGFAISATGLAYFMQGGMTFGNALVNILPMFAIFAVIGWSFCRMGADGFGLAAGYLSACVGLCGLAAAWLFGT